MAAPDEMEINLSHHTVDHMQKLAERSGYSLTELVKLGIAAATVVIEARENGHVIVEATAEGQILTEISFPETSTTRNKIVRNLLAEPCSLSLERAIADLDPDHETPSPPLHHSKPRGTGESHNQF